MYQVWLYLFCDKINTIINSLLRDTVMLRVVRQTNQTTDFNLIKM